MAHTNLFHVHLLMCSFCYVLSCALLQAAGKQREDLIVFELNSLFEDAELRGAGRRCQCKHWSTPSVGRAS